MKHHTLISRPAPIGKAQVTFFQGLLDLLLVAYDSVIEFLFRKSTI